MIYDDVKKRRLEAREAEKKWERAFATAGDNYQPLSRAMLERNRNAYRTLIRMALDTGDKAKAIELQEAWAEIERRNTRDG